MIYVSSRADRYLLEPLMERLDRTDTRYLLVLGDRRETFETAVRYFLDGFPIIHIQGGESTPFSRDDVYRDCITRMACLHFAPTEQAIHRIYQIHPGTVVVTCGAIGAELASKMVPIPRADLPFRTDGKTWLVTWHPQPHEDVEELIEALQAHGGDVIWTYPNADPGRENIISKIREAGYQPYVELNMSVYLSLMHYVTAVVGNSSSGLIEAPSIGTQTINIGFRQYGRPQAKSVASVACRKAEIEAALQLTDSMPVYAKDNPYYRPGTIDTIVREIRKRYA